MTSIQLNPPSDVPFEPPTPKIENISEGFRADAWGGLTIKIMSQMPRH